MSSHLQTNLSLNLSVLLPTTTNTTFTPPLSAKQIPSGGVWPFCIKDKRLDLTHQRCSAISESRSQDYVDVLQSGLSELKWHGMIESDAIKRQGFEEVLISNETRERIRKVKTMLRSMDDGEITISAYDTAWVAMVEDINGDGKPQFPSSLQWIADNQLLDGSWGDHEIYSAHDRLINTLACVIALTTWNIHPEKCQKGIKFFKENICELEKENAEHMPIGFEVAFPSLLEIARSLNIDVPQDSPVLQEIYERRNLKLTRIPKEILHKVPTTLLHSLEGMAGLDWKKLLKLQCKDGSFLFSPSSTAFALMQTKDDNCLKYLNNAVHKFHGGVPNVYPVDMFEHMWVVDRLQRLGISRYFKSEIEDCMDYVSRYWTEVGICWARNTHVQDIDDTAMGFRLLRLHGYDVSADVFNHFRKDDEFFCFVGQSNQAVTGMYNLYRASQIQFPGDQILEDAQNFSLEFLRKRQAANELFDKWIITKDLPGEVGFALDVPWYANLPRVESRFYIDQYGGDDDVWIGKTLYRMPFVNNNTYLELAKTDYNNIQALHQVEWQGIHRWYEENRLGDWGLSKRNLLLNYFVAAASIYEPERSNERLAWAKTAALVEAISLFFNDENTLVEEKKSLVKDFKTRVSARDHGRNGRWLALNKTGQGLSKALFGNLNHLSLDALVAHGQDISHHLYNLWENWLMSLQEKTFNMTPNTAELLVRTINLTGGRCAAVTHPEYKRLSDLANRIFQKLGHSQWDNKGEENGKAFVEAEGEMQELVQTVLQDSTDGIDRDLKQTFLQVVKAYYYTAHCDLGTINLHIAKVLFERV
ncbi:hypothetical protein ACFE04_031633 [Oxalis oulophora]